MRAPAESRNADSRNADSLAEEHLPTPPSRPAAGRGDRFVVALLPEGQAAGQHSPLDAIRGLAVLMVFGHHAWALAGAPPMPLRVFGATWHMAPLFFGGGFGIDVFFVLSGFLLSHRWHANALRGGPRPSVRRYLRQRMRRIVPPYWFMLMMMLVLLTGTVIPWSAVGSPDGRKAVVAHLLFAQQLFPVTSAGFAGVNGSLWTLTIEMIFYLVLPAMMILFLGNRWRIYLPLACLVSVTATFLALTSLWPVVLALHRTVARYQVPEASIRAFMAAQFPSFVGEFALGIVAAGLWVGRSAPERWSPYRWPSACGGLAVVGAGLLVAQCALSLSRTPPFNAYSQHLVAALAATFMIVGSLGSVGRIRRCYELLPLRVVGILGYSIFLWHMPIMRVAMRWPALQRLGDGHGVARLATVSLPLTLLVGGASYWFVERPFMRRGSDPAPLRATP